MLEELDVDRQLAALSLQHVFPHTDIDEISGIVKCHSDEISIFSDLFSRPREFSEDRVYKITNTAQSSRGSGSTFSACKKRGASGRTAAPKQEREPIDPYNIAGLGTVYDSVRGPRETTLNFQVSLTGIDANIEQVLQAYVIRMAEGCDYKLTITWMNSDDTHGQFAARINRYITAIFGIPDAVPTIAEKSQSMVFEIQT